MEVGEVEIKVTDANFKQEVLESDIPVLVDFWAEWCGPCHIIAPIVKTIATEYEGKLKVCKVNVDEAPGTASEYNIMSIPTLAIFKDGEIVDKVIGVVPKAQLEAAIKPHI
ncbi:MAG: thioredoxin [Candidatus Auribacterota bacterium]|nr:thioredoxin [Candidatus Auribacterota bacterium]